MLMKTFNFHIFNTNALCLLFVLSFINMKAQNDPVPVAPNFWDKVQFGGGLGLGFGSGYTDITVAPSGIYNFNNYVALGVGLQGSYVSTKNLFSSAIYGGSVIGLFNPINEIQLSAELEQVRVNSTIKGQNSFQDIKDNFWNTGLFLGAGYRAGNVTVGARYNVLFKENNFVYSDAFMPFVRVFF
jgi:long-subunit fatty acid transport protein